jgi:hypothetical protein
VSRRPWTGAERLRLLRLADTLPTSALAERFGRTRKAIRDQLWLLRGRCRPKPSGPFYDPLVCTAAAGALAAEIKRARDESATTAPYRPGPLLW